MFIALRAEGANFVKEAQKEGAKAGDAAGKTFGDRLKANAGKLIGGALAAGFAVATKGALEAEAAQGKFMAATGATREEAKKFVSDMNSLAGTSGAVGKSFEEISATGTEVARQFKLTGQAGADMTQDFLAFSKVTGQDAVGAVEQLDGTLDAFHLPAERATSLMDQFIVSNQRFGTDVGPETITQLNKMAPALQAMGMDIDDGIGLLNLFEDAGLDAAGATKGLNAAILNIPPGETLETVLTKIQAIEDPFERAQAAVEIFGAKAGSGLANALVPGGKSLDDYKVTVQEADGATERASENMLTLGDRIKGWADKALAGAREIGNQFGPLVTGAASVASLAGPLVKSFGGLKSFGPLKIAIAAAGSAAGLIYTGAVTVAQGLASALAGMWNRIPGSTALNNAIGNAGTKWGQLAGGRFGLAFKAAGVLAVAAIAAEYGDEVDQAGADLGERFWSNFGDPEKGLAHGTVLDTLADAIHDIWDWLGELDLPGNSGFPKAMGDSIRGAQPQIESAVEGAAGWISSSGSWADAGRRAALSAAGAFGAVAPQWIETAKQALLAPFRAIGAAIPGQIGQGMQQAATVLIEGANVLRDILQNGLSPKKLAMVAIGQENIDLVREGMLSRKFGAKETAIEVAIASIAAIESAGLTGAKGQKGLKRIGQYFDELLASGMSGAEALAALEGAGVDVSSEALSGIRSKYPQFFNQGVTASDKFEAGLRTFTPVQIGNLFRSGSFGGINPMTGKPWGARASGGPVSADMPYLVGEEGPELFIPKRNGFIAPNQAGAGSVPIGGNTYITNNNAEIVGLPLYAETPAAVARQMSRVAALGELPRRAPSLRRTG